MSAQQHYHSHSVADIFKQFNTRPSGLTHEEARKRQEHYGLNTLPKTRPALTPLTIFLEQWQSPLILLLVVAAVVSFFIGDLVDAGVILATACINAAVGFIQENKANRALVALKEYLQEWATVVREKQEERIKAEEVVPGDIIVIEAGDKITADARLIQMHELQANEMVLTGESSPVNKITHTIHENTVLAERLNMCFRGTTVTNGNARAVVVATGERTELGKIARLLKETKNERTPLQVQIGRLGTLLTYVMTGLALTVFVAGLVRSFSLSDIFVMSVAVAVAAIPEGLVISVTVILAIGMQRILKKNALVRRLVTAETLGSISVIATDKTGTLTLGEMRVTEFYADGVEYTATQKKQLLPSLMGKAYGVVELLWMTNFFCNNATRTNPEAPPEDWQFIGDSTEAALKRFVYESELPYKEWEKKTVRGAELPFNSERKFMAVAVESEHEHWLLVKGAPEVLLARSAHVYAGGRKVRISEDVRRHWHQRIEKCGARGLRTLGCAALKLKDAPGAIAHNDVHELVFLGIAALKDPLRKEVKEALRVTQKAGVRTIMVTGDHPLTARAIATELGMDMSDEKSVVTGADIEGTTDAAMQHLVQKTSVFARVNPEHKMRVLRALQANNEVVAMSGDGVNDAPALKAADIGVAVGSGTSIAKETADLVLLDDNFRTIVLAVEQGRSIFENIRKVVLYLMGNSFAEVVLVIGAIIMGLPLPLTAIQILWTNLIVDSFPNIALAFEPGESEVMRERPRPKQERIMNREMKILVYIIGLTSNVILLGIVVYLQTRGLEITLLRTIVFATLSFSTLLFVYSARSLRRTVFQTNLFSNPPLLAATLVGALLVIAGVYTPLFQSFLDTVALPLWSWGVVAVFSLINVALIEVAKYVLIIRKQRFA